MVRLKGVFQKTALKKKSVSLCVGVQTCWFPQNQIKWQGNYYYKMTTSFFLGKDSQNCLGSLQCFTLSLNWCWAECSHPNFWATKYSWNQLSKSKGWMKNHVIFSLFSILFFKWTCFKEDQCPDPSVSSTTVRDMEQRKRQEYGFFKGNWSLGCPALIVYEHKRHLDLHKALRKPG